MMPTDESSKNASLKILRSSDNLRPLFHSPLQRWDYFGFIPGI
jgi:hypothetical protein